MAEIKIEKKERRNFIPLLIAGLLLLALFGWCASRNRNDPSTRIAGDSAAVRDDSMSAPESSSPMSGSAGTGAGGASGVGGAAAAGGASTAAGAATQQNGIGGPAVRAFDAFVTSRDTAQETEGNHAYTAAGVRELAAALEEVAGTSPKIAADAQRMRAAVTKLQHSSSKDVHADDVKVAFAAAVNAMDVIARARHRTYDVAPMRVIYTSLQSHTPLMQQLSTVHRFFEASRDALRTLGATG